MFEKESCIMCYHYNECNANGLCGSFSRRNTYDDIVSWREVDRNRKKYYEAWVEYVEDDEDKSSNF